MAIQMDIGKCLVDLTYVNEGDSFLSPHVHDQVIAAHATIVQVLGTQGVYVAPNLTAIAVASYPGDQDGANTLINDTLQKGMPVLRKFEGLFIGPGAKRLSFMKIMQFFRLLQPGVVEHASNVSLYDDISIVLSIPHLRHLHSAMLLELPIYVAATRGVEAKVDLLVSFLYLLSSTFSLCSPL